MFSLFARTQTDDDDIPEELLLGKQQLSELASDSAKVKAMGIFNTVKNNACAFTARHKACLELL